MRKAPHTAKPIAELQSTVSITMRTATADFSLVDKYERNAPKESHLTFILPQNSLPDNGSVSFGVQVSFPLVYGCETGKKG